MSEREKRLLFLLLGALFVILNLGLYKKVYEVRLNAADSKLVTAKAELDQAKTLIETRDLYESEMSWLSRNKPRPSSVQQAQTRLEQFVKGQARSQRLDIKSTKLQSSITDASLNYQRVRIQVTLNGLEQQLYSFLSRLHSPNDFRAVTVMRLNPQKNDDTRIDCQILVEQWISPLGSEENPVASN